MSVWLLLLLLPVLAFAELPPYRPYKGPIKPGLVITRDNLPQYEAELKKLLPPSKHHWYLDLGVRAGRVTMPIVPMKAWPLSRGVLEATRRYAGQARVGPHGELLGWTAGVPFPHPKTALELAWDCYPDISRACSHDDTLFACWFGLFKEDRYEKHFCWELRKKKYMGRCDIPPIPCMPEAKSRGVLSKESIVITRPHEVRGFIQLRVRYWALDKGDECYSYIPALRRIRRMTGADLTDPLLGSDCIQDDFEVWRQKLNPKMTFRVLERRDFLVPRWYTEKPSYDRRRHGPVFQVDWELRPCWVMEIMTNDPDYAYSKRVVYLDAVPIEKGGTFILYWGEEYDQRGRMWRANGQGAPSDDGRGFKNLFGWMYMNVLAHHYTIMYGDPSFPNLDPSQAFTVKGLLRRVH